MIFDKIVCPMKSVAKTRGIHRQLNWASIEKDFNIRIPDDKKKERKKVFHET